MEGRSAEEEAVRVVDKTASLRSARDHQRLPEERSEIQNDWRRTMAANFGNCFRNFNLWAHRAVNEI
ncbi:MAG: hypothetical protein E5V25_00350 [Mesorhizobium sp.]|nr:MAG: hypothetical protein E5V25_00350 [Mesorhizobium sp.]